MEPQNGCWEDVFPFNFGGFLGSMSIFQGAFDLEILYLWSNLFCDVARNEHISLYV